MSLRDNKVGMFGERNTVDEAVDYASEVAGPEGVTAAMVMYNTLMEVLAQKEDSKSDSESNNGE